MLASNKQSDDKTQINTLAVRRMWPVLFALIFINMLTECLTIFLSLECFSMLEIHLNYTIFRRLKSIDAITKGALRKYDGLH